MRSPIVQIDSGRVASSGSSGPCRRSSRRVRGLTMAVRDGAPVTLRGPVARRPLRDDGVRSSRSSRRSSRTACRGPRTSRRRVEFEQTVADRGAVPATIAVLDGVAHVGLEPRRARAARAAPGRRAEAQRPGPPGRDGPGSHRRHHGRRDRAARLARGHPRVRHRRDRRRPPRRCAPRSTSRPTSGSSGAAGSPSSRRASSRSSTSAPRSSGWRRLGVTVLVFGTDRFPAFWLTDSGYTVDSPVTTAEEIAADDAGGRCARPLRAGSWWPTRCPRPRSSIPRCTTACSPRRSTPPTAQPCAARRSRRSCSTTSTSTPAARAWRSTSRSSAATAGSGPIRTGVGRAGDVGPASLTATRGRVSGDPGGLPPVRYWRPRLDGTEGMQAVGIGRLVQGDLFGRPADMIALPCSTEGTVTGPVERRWNSSHSRTRDR